MDLSIERAFAENVSQIEESAWYKDIISIKNKPLDIARLEGAPAINLNLT